MSFTKVLVIQEYHEKHLCKIHTRQPVSLGVRFPLSLCCRRAVYVCDAFSVHLTAKNRKQQ